MKAQRLSTNFLVFLIVLLWPPRPQSQESVRCDAEWEREHRCRGCGHEVTPDSCFAFHLPQPLGFVSPVEPPWATVSSLLPRVAG